MRDNTMKALVFDKGLHLVDREVPVPSEEEALIKVRVVGICNTDVEITRGYMDFRGIPGHEFVGEVVECQHQEWLGKRVVGEINLGCGICRWCRSGMSRHCLTRTVLGIQGKDGVFAQYVTLPVGNLHVVPDHLPDSRAIFAEPLAAALEILEQVKVDPAWRVLVIGDGKLAILVTRVLMRTGADVSVLGVNRKKLALFEQSGATIFTIDDDFGDGYDMVVEASGSPDGWNQAISALRPRGIIVLKSTYHGDLHWNTAPLVINEVTVVGSRCGLFAPALELLSDPSFETADLIEAIYPLDQAIESFERSQMPDSMKVLIGMDALDKYSGFPPHIVQDYSGYDS